MKYFFKFIPNIKILYLVIMDIKSPRDTQKHNIPFFSEVYRQSRWFIQVIGKESGYVFSI